MAGCLSPPTTAVGLHNLTRPDRAVRQLQSELTDSDGSGPPFEGLADRSFDVRTTLTEAVIR